MKSAGHWGEELRADTVELHCDSGQHAKDSDTFDGSCVPCSITRLVRIKIDANDFACAVRDCFWRLHCVGEAYNHSKVDQSNTGQPACIIHIGNAADYLRQICICELGVLWAIEYIILCRYDKERGNRLYRRES